MTIEEKRRELFEAWWKAEGRHRKHQGIISGDEEIGFELWCAALDAVVIELPEPESPESIGVIKAEDLEEYQALEARMGAQYSAIHKCRLSIESTGLGLKVKS